LTLPHRQRESLPYHLLRNLESAQSRCIDEREIRRPSIKSYVLSHCRPARTSARCLVEPLWPSALSCKRCCFHTWTMQPRVRSRYRLSIFTADWRPSKNPRSNTWFPHKKLVLSRLVGSKVLDPTRLPALNAFVTSLTMTGFDNCLPPIRATTRASQRLDNDDSTRNSYTLLLVVPQ
jgi:hypothetical protein